MPATVSKPIPRHFSLIIIFLLIRPVHHVDVVVKFKSMTHLFFNLATCGGEYYLCSGLCNRRLEGGGIGHRRNTLLFKEKSELT